MRRSIGGGGGGGGGGGSIPKRRSSLGGTRRRRHRSRSPSADSLEAGGGRSPLAELPPSAHGGVSDAHYRKEYLALEKKYDGLEKRHQKAVRKVGRVVFGCRIGLLFTGLPPTTHTHTPCSWTRRRRTVTRCAPRWTPTAKT